jgi:hypothetical protein
MTLRLTLVLALVLAAAANAAGPSPGLLQGPAGITTPTQKYRFAALHRVHTTQLAAIDKSTGKVVRSRLLRGQWGIPYVTFDGAVDGLSRDGSMLVIADSVPPRNGPFRPSSSFRVYGTSLLDLRNAFTLRGDFSFDALSPDGRTLYLIQHLGTGNDIFRYLVRAYDLQARRLLPQAIADKRQQGWVMRGLPMKRLASADGRWVYTLYRQDGGYPFVHALDSVNRSAVCIGIPWQGSQDPLESATLVLAGGKLLISAGGRQFAIDTEAPRLESVS